MIDQDRNQSLRDSFLNPPSTHGPIPFYWWVGEPLQRERISWQLDQLADKGVKQAVISYPHDEKGHTDLGDPALFSPQWWDLFRWFLGQCKQRGMTVGFQDYTLVEPILLAIGQSTPDMQGGQMDCRSQKVGAAEVLRLSIDPGCSAVAAWAYPLVDEVAQIDGAISLLEQIDESVLTWQAPAGDWLVALVFVRPNAFDPMHPDAGKLAIDQLYAPFERECPGEVGKTLNLFFQDELGFGCRMPFWSNRLMERFVAQKGYDLAPLLPALWHDVGAITEKVRIDYADVVVTTLEERYFRPVFEWHEQRGVMFGHDNSGRGRMAQGRSFYGDYFRTMRWFSAPGCDDPKLHGARAFKGLKVNSSIAHLYQRPRVWIEAFHSSGWGTQPADVMAALNEDFAYGATVVNLHGLYYSTRAGWWEWAPPDFHFRQPYWQHAKVWNQALTRLSWILSQGVHRCDVGIVYPIEALDVEAVDPSMSGVVAHVENENVGADQQDPRGAEETAFVIGKHLFDHACDFDFVDFESIASAQVKDGIMFARNAQYRVLVIPAMRALRYATLLKARDFVREGGLVIAFGCLPKASERAGRDDAELDALLLEIFGSREDREDLLKRHPSGGMGVFLASDFRRVLSQVSQVIDRAVTSSKPLQVLHREMGESDVYFINNASDDVVTSQLRFRSQGRCEIWDAMSGGMEPLDFVDELSLTLAARQAHLLVIHRGVASNPVQQIDQSVQQRETIISLEGAWDSLLEPTLDNRYADFSLPASSELLGAQTRRFRYCKEHEESHGWQAVDFDDAAWSQTSYSYGPQMEVIGPFAPESDEAKREQLVIGKSDKEWHEYHFSRRWGIENDPFLTDWLSGPHGLKGVVPDDYLDFYTEVPGSVWYVRAKVVAPMAGEYQLVTGARCRYQVWINGASVLEQTEESGPGRHAPWNIPHYECEHRETRVSLVDGENDILLQLVQPVGQRTRAFLAFNPPQHDRRRLALRWFTDSSLPRPCYLAPASRRALRFRFVAPSGAKEISFVSRGPCRAWVDGLEIPLQVIEKIDGNGIRYRGVLESASLQNAIVALRVEAPRDSHAGDALPEPVTYVCVAGQMECGDWCAQGLASYSGMVHYSRRLTVVEPFKRATLDLGHVAATAEVQVNGCVVATLLSPPWTCDLSSHLHVGENELTVTVANTLANHYSVGIPSPYAFTHQTPSGLIGPVQLILHS